ncbi:Uncharacterized protein M6B38_248335 [Iris pallida]|uniref:VPS9 domain-containing protein n=1 Tax=Iris pallida TaxID=29817 RepID=A0AAX6DG82_IRIPA|nr:Uncharacterized protein M6B38_248335 [Iris pallida]
MDSSSSSHLPEPNFYDFLRRMRSPASADLVRAIKSFIVSFSLHTIDAENDSRKLQDFLMAMETNIRKHPLWINCTDEERDTAVEGLEKYVMTKLFNRTFASSPGDAKSDMKISKKICLLQQFIKPDHLDVPKVLQNEASLLYAAKELQKINAFKAPREKLLCIMNCCRVIIIYYSMFHYQQITCQPGLMIFYLPSFTLSSGQILHSCTPISSLSSSFAGNQNLYLKWSITLPISSQQNHLSQILMLVHYPWTRLNSRRICTLQPLK